MPLLVAALPLPLSFFSLTFSFSLSFTFSLPCLPCLGRSLLAFFLPPGGPPAAVAAASASEASACFCMRCSLRSASSSVPKSNSCWSQVAGRLLRALEDGRRGYRRSEVGCAMPPAASEQPRLRSRVSRRLLCALSKAGWGGWGATVTEGGREQHHRRAAPLGHPPPRGAQACRRAELPARSGSRLESRSRRGSRADLLDGAAPRP